MYSAVETRRGKLRGHLTNGATACKGEPGQRCGKHGHEPQIMKLLSAALLYFIIVFGVGFVFGPIRVIWLEPRLGKPVAVLCELPLLLAAMMLAARWVPRRVRVDASLRSLASMGILALAFQQIADFAVGIGLRGMTPSQQFASFSTPAGLVYLAALLVFAAMPTLVNGGRSSS